jgi:hypothetical protein
MREVAALRFTTVLSPTRIPLKSGLKGLAGLPTQAEYAVVSASY